MFRVIFKDGNEIVEKEILSSKLWLLFTHWGNVDFDKVFDAWKITNEDIVSEIWDNFKELYDYEVKNKDFKPIKVVFKNYF